jgi:tRNA threonylcarbamoyladenosine biosynthesis protein TsaE
MSPTIHLPDLAATEALGRRLGPLLFPGAVVALVGGLGAGKTNFTRAVAEGLGVKNAAAVTSPTFTLIHEYPARLPVYHFDAYRLNSPAEFVALGTDEYFHGDGVCVVEWADRVTEALPAERLELHFRVLSEREREVRVVPLGERYVRLAEHWLGASVPQVSAQIDAEV